MQHPEKKTESVSNVSQSTLLGPGSCATIAFKECFRCIAIKVATVVCGGILRKSLILTGAIIQAGFEVGGKPGSSGG